MCRRSEASERMKMKTTACFYSDSLALSLSFADHDISGIGTLRVEVHVGNRHFSDKSTCNLVEHAVDILGPHICVPLCV